VLLWQAPFKENDWIEIDGHVGEVIKMGSFKVRLRTTKNKHILIPNLKIVNNDIVSYTPRYVEYGHPLIHINITTALDCNVKQINDLLKEAAYNLPESLIIHSKEPFIFVTITQEGNINHELNCYLADISKKEETYSKLYEQVIALLKNNNINLIIPEYNVDYHC
jgi:potassium efflux system protein